MFQFSRPKLADYLSSGTESFAEEAAERMLRLVGAMYPEACDFQLQRLALAALEAITSEEPWGSSPRCWAETVDEAAFLLSEEWEAFQRQVQQERAQEAA